MSSYFFCKIVVNCDKVKHKYLQQELLKRQKRNFIPIQIVFSFLYQIMSYLERFENTVQTNIKYRYAYPHRFNLRFSSCDLQNKNAKTYSFVCNRIRFVSITKTFQFGRISNRTLHNTINRESPTVRKTVFILTSYSVTCRHYYFLVSV